MALALTILGFVLGAMPWAVWLGQWGLKKDIRTYGDHNPGAFNMLRAGGVMWGGLAIALEIGKGALPVGLASTVFGVDGWGLVACAVAPVIGHAFSPFLGFKGGKAIAVTFGTWIGLTLWTVPLVSALSLVVWYRLLTVSGWAVMGALACMALFFVLTPTPWEHWAAFAVQVGVLVYRHRADLRQPLRLRALAKREAAG
ncbi:MAG: glycerol-3-phosphate acyltransferase [Anaerolineae bacterium]|nr:glycerol-3-phosphate acyltransferase [Anaerolineae bacterium]